MNDDTAIIPRNIRFGFDTDLPLNWHSDDPATSRFYDALSLLFPSGERMFIDSVRLFADRVTDPKLQADIKAFTAQESIHSREHARYNALLTAQGIDVEGFGRLANALSKPRSAGLRPKPNSPSPAPSSITQPFLPNPFLAIRVSWTVRIPSTAISGAGMRWKKKNTKPSPLMCIAP